MGIVKTALKSSADPWRGAEMTFIDSATIIFSLIAIRCNGAEIYVAKLFRKVIAVNPTNE